MQLVGDRVVGGFESRHVDRFWRNLSPPARVAQLADEVHVVARMNEVKLVELGGSRSQQAAVIEEPGGSDQVDSELDPDRLERMLVRKVVLHELVAVDERDCSGHGNLP